MNETDTSNPRSRYSVELFVRSLAPTGIHERQQAIVSRIRELADRNRIESVSSTVWGDRICPDTAAQLAVGRSILDDVDRLRTWAHRQGVSLEPFFEDREVASMFEGTYTIIVPPVLCLAVYARGEIEGVFPCANGDEIHTIMDGLDALSDAEAVLPELFSDRTFVES